VGLPGILAINFATNIKLDISKLIADMHATSSVTLTLTVREFLQELRFE